MFGFLKKKPKVTQVIEFEDGTVFRGELAKLYAALEAQEHPAQRRFNEMIDEMIAKIDRDPVQGERLSDELENEIVAYNRDGGMLH